MSLRALIGTASAAVIALHGVAALVPGRRLWGLDHLAYFPPLLRWTALAVALSVLLPGVGRRLARFISRVIGPLFRAPERLHRDLGRLLAAALSVALFASLATSTHLLGDGYLRLRNLRAGALVSGTEPLDVYLHAKLHQLAHRWLGCEPETTYATLSCLAGGAFVFAALKLALALSRGRGGGNPLVVVALLASGGMQLYFGYVESYSFMHLGVLLTILFAVRLLTEGGSPLPVVIALVVASAFHLSAIYLVPSALFLLGRELRAQGGRRASAFAGLGLIAAGLIAAILVLRSGSGSRLILLPLRGGEAGAYSLLSPAHLADLLNEFLLVAPVAVAGIVPALLLASRADREDPVVRYLVLVSISGLGFAAAVDPRLGYARDWDLFASTGLGPSVLVSHLLFRSLRARPHVQYAAVSLAAAALVGTVPWIGLNADPGRAIARFKTLLKLDRSKSAYGHETLAIYYRDRGLGQEEIEEWEAALAVSTNARHLVSLGLAHAGRGDKQAAIASFERATLADPGSFIAHSNLATSLIEMGDYELARASLVRALEIGPGDAFTHSALGALLVSMGRLEEAISELTKALEMDPALEHARRNLGIARLRSGAIEEAIRDFESYLRANPADREVAALVEELKAGLASPR